MELREMIRGTFAVGESIPQFDAGVFAVARVGERLMAVVISREVSERMREPVKRLIA